MSMGSVILCIRCKPSSDVQDLQRCLYLRLLDEGVGVDMLQRTVSMQLALDSLHDEPWRETCLVIVGKGESGRAMSILASFIALG